MKRLFAILAAALAIGTTSANAAQDVTSVWAFNIANIQGSYYRGILEQANKDQDKYKFVAEHKPGAGGDIGAGFVAGKKELALLGTAAAYFVRPYLYSQNAYDFNTFRPVHVMALSPAALVTKPGRKLEDILKQDKITIGTAGAGALTHLMALKYKENLPGKQVVITPYKSSTEALQDVLGGHIDLTFEFLGDAEAKGANIVGVTGRTKVKSYPLLKDIGYSNQADLVGVYLILVKKDTPDAVVNELRAIFEKAEKNTRVQELYASDYSSKPEGLTSEAAYQTWYKKTIEYYKGVTEGQRIN
jgi:tripartite-type tricarboxylate transporter receptor subunit TctC